MGCALGRFTTAGNIPGVKLSVSRPSCERQSFLGMDHGASMSADLDQFTKVTNQGHSAAWDQQWDQASRFYRQALELSPDNPKALMSLGLALFELKSYDEALTCYQNAARITPTDPVAYEKISQICEALGNTRDAVQSALQAGELFIRQKDVEKALANWTRVTVLNPENLMAHSRLALTYEHLSRRQQAVTEFLVIAGLLQYSGDPGKAMQSVSHALQLDPQSNEARQAMTLLRTNQRLPRPMRPRPAAAVQPPAETPELKSPAKDTSTPVPAQDPVDAARQNAMTQLAGLLFDQGDEENSVLQLSRRGMGAIERGSGSLPFENADRTKIMLHLGQAIESQTVGRFAQAAEELQHAIELGLTQASAYFALGLAHVQGGTCDSALHPLQEAVKHPAYNLAARLLMGEALEKLNRAPEAAVEYLEALGIADSSIAPHELALDIRQMYEPLVEAQRHDTDVEHAKSLCKTITSMLRQKDWKANLVRAREQLPTQPEGSPPLPIAEMLLQTQSSHLIDSLAMIRTLAANGHYRTAMEEAYSALVFAPTYLPIHSQIAEMMIPIGLQAEAIQKLTIVSHMYSLRGEAGQSTRILRRIIHLSPMDLAARTRLIDQLVAQGQVDAAMEEYLELADLYYHRAELDMARKTYTAGLRTAQQVKSTRNYALEILERIADIDQQRLDWRQAISTYEQMRNLAPNDPTLRMQIMDLNYRMGQAPAALLEMDNYLGLLDRSGQKASQVNFLEAVVKQYGSNFEVLKRIADHYQRLGMADCAVEVLDKLGDMLLKSGNKAAAVAVVQTILTLNPPNAADYRSLLEQIKS